MDFLRKNFVYKWAVSHKRTQKCRDKAPQLHWFIHRTLPFSEFVKRASERKHSDFFLCEVTNVQTCFVCSTIVPTVVFSVASLQDESYYLRSLGEDVRKVQNRIMKLKTDAVVSLQKLFMAAFDSLTGTCWSQQTVSWPCWGFSRSTVLYPRAVFLQRVPHQLLWSAVVDTLRCEPSFNFSSVLCTRQNQLFYLKLSCGVILPL